MALRGDAHGQMRCMHQAVSAWKGAFDEARRLRQARFRVQWRCEQRALTECWDLWTYLAWDGSFARKEALLAASRGQEDPGGGPAPLPPASTASITRFSSRATEHSAHGGLVSPSSPLSAASGGAEGAGYMKRAEASPASTHESAVEHLAPWLARTEAHQRLRRVGEGILTSRRVTRGRGAAFRAWAALFSSRRRVRRVGEVLLRRRSRGLLARGMAAWLARIAAHRGLRRVGAVLCRRGDRALLARGMGRWRQLVHRGRLLQCYSLPPPARPSLS
ncbi:hypothetical protein T484DRAFT_1898488 [Baffinella frigidus]|nr:hypothetical protein T484DRAFT_1898488 [Cryptophyta sp. CCMP2293]